MIRVFVFSLLVALVASRAEAEIPPHPALDEIGVEPQIGQSVPPDIVLRDLEGATVRAADIFRGERPILLVLAYSDCPMLCSLVLRGLADAVAESEGRPGAAYDVVTVSIDPEESPDVARRTRTRLAALAGVADQPAQWRYLLGEEGEVRRLANALGFRYRYDAETEQYAHPAAVFVLSGAGLISAVLRDLRHEPGAIDAAVATARAGETSNASTLSAILSCFRFDPADRRYGASITLALRLLGLGLLGGLGALLWFFSRRRRSR